MEPESRNHLPFSIADTVSLVVEPTHEGQRLDKFLCTRLPSYSRSFFQTLIDSQHITVNGQITTKASMLLKPASTVQVQFPEPQKRPSGAFLSELDLGIEILYTHEHFFIVYKPATVLVHPTDNDIYSPTLVDWLLCRYAELKTVGESERPGVVHRLDKDTSGLLVIARTNYAHMTFGDMFKNRTIKKTYLAVVRGAPPASGSIDLPIGRNPVHRKKMMTFSKIDDFSPATTRKCRGGQEQTARQSLTHFTTKEYFQDCALVEVKPVTGRTHQIRVHFASLGHSLLGDQLYGQTSKLITRQALHAYSLSFSFQNEQFTFQKDAPADFQALLATLRNA